MTIDVCKIFHSTISPITILLLLILSVGCDSQTSPSDIEQYQAAKTNGQFNRQVQLATQIIAAQPDKLTLSMSQLKQAQGHYKALTDSPYYFADKQLLEDAQGVIKLAPHVEVAKQAVLRYQRQHKIVIDIKQRLARLAQLQTDFDDNLTATPSHQTVSAVGVTLPDFLDSVDEQTYLGAYYQGMKHQSLDNYQLQQLLSHANQVLDLARPLSEQLTALTAEHSLQPGLLEQRSSVSKINALYRQTLSHMLIALMRNGLDAGLKAYNSISNAASSQMYRGRINEVWLHQIRPLSQKEWKLFDKQYLQPIQAVRLVLINQVDKQGPLAPLFAQTYPHAKLSYRYFWPKDDDLSLYLKQGNQLAVAAKKIVKVLSTY